MKLLSPVILVIDFSVVVPENNQNRHISPLDSVECVCRRKRQIIKN